MADKKGKGIPAEAIVTAVTKAEKGQLDELARLQHNDESVAYDLIIVAIYKAFKRRGGSHTQCVEATKQVIDSADIKVVIK
jgi:hypothetical protein